MTKYTLTLNTQDSPSQGYEYSLDLTQEQEDNPQSIFTPNKCKEIQVNLQNQSLCAIQQHHLHQIISTWIEDIQLGYRDTSITLELPLLIEANIETIEEKGNQQLPPPFLPDLSGIEPTSGMLPPLEEIYQP